MSRILDTGILSTSNKYKNYCTNDLLKSVESIDESTNKIFEALYLLKEERRLIIDELHCRGEFLGETNL